jgi:signal transduction histidine kinase
VIKAVDNEVVREALINLDRSHKKERLLREQANSLLEGLEIITSATGTEDMLGQLLKMVTEQLQCEDAFILSPQQKSMECEKLDCIGATDPLFREREWVGGKIFKRALAGHPVMLFSVLKVEEWQQQSEEVQQKCGSVLLISFPGVDRPIILCCVSRQRAYFNKTHLSLMQRMMPIASHALHTLYFNEQLRQEIDERNRLEQYASFQAGIAEMSASVLHNIGNTVTGGQGHLLKIEQQRKNLLGLVKVFGAVHEWTEAGPLSDAQVEKVDKVLQGAAKILTEVVGEEGSMLDGLGALNRANQHVAEIIQMQRGVSRPVLTASEFSIEQMITDTLSMIEEGIERRGIVVSVDIHSLLKALYLPRNPMIQMLLNLVKNSIESIDERKQTDEQLSGAIQIQVSPDGEAVRLVVKDNGVGIEPERFKEVFKFGESSKERGSGFGLHSVANFVEGVEGRVAVESDGINCGAKVVVRLPQRMADRS